MKIMIKWKFLLFLLPSFFVFFFIYKIMVTKGPTHCKLPARLDHFCNDPLLPEHGEEGQVDSGKYRLRSLHIFTRHGDRSALHVLDTKKHATRSFKCFYEDWLVKGMPVLHDFVENMRHNKGVLETPAFQKYSKKSLYPDIMTCPTGALTPKGTAQLVRNGLFLQEKYLKHIEFDKPLDFRVTTTTFTRTFQTAVAFAYGFIRHLNLSSIPFETVSKPNMCTEHSPLKCDCSATYGMDNVLSCTYKQSWAPQNPKESPSESLRSKVWQTFLFDPNRATPSPSPVFDFLVSHYCHQQQFVDNCFLAGVFNHVNNHGRKMAKNQAYIKSSILKMLPIISEVSAHIQKSSASPSSQPFVRLFSGHDTTIEPLLAALGVGDGYWPKYSSRFVIEHYSSVAEKQDFVRFLFDGKPVTQLFKGCLTDSKFVDKYSLCPVERLFSFVESHSKKYRVNCFKSVPQKAAEKMPKEGAP